MVGAFVSERVGAVFGQKERGPSRSTNRALLGGHQQRRLPSASDEPTIEPNL